ncbi:hypothetical protein EDB95_4978 [Dinghuibacter silviterrae]|uniref:Uncharacterized protein n=2 Tax=Dinghuibacter silviterrae TaxID=1539049 RepID=A0A4R8DHX1_9BACT|nr:hypothetical protein EDB95_4978 [Dinghuibacter silviterrae]
MAANFYTNSTGGDTGYKRAKHMTTTLKNVSFEQEITAFLRSPLPTNPVPFAIALVDAVRQHGAAWIKTDAAKALLHLLNQQAHGQGYRLDSHAEFDRLAKVFER